MADTIQIASKKIRPRVEGGFVRIEKIRHYAHGVY
jgi:hypothetical protein